MHAGDRVYYLVWNIPNDFVLHRLSDSETDEKDHTVYGIPDSETKVSHGVYDVTILMGYQTFG